MKHEYIAVNSEQEIINLLGDILSKNDLYSKYSIAKYDSSHGEHIPNGWVCWINNGVMFELIHSNYVSARIDVDQRYYEINGHLNINGISTTLKFILTMNGILEREWHRVNI